MGRKYSARARFEAALVYAQQAGNHAPAVSAQKQLIYTACAERDFACAQTMAEALLQSRREAGRWYVATHALEALEHIAYLQQNYPLARTYGEQALAIYPNEETTNRSNTLRSLSRTTARQRDYQSARDYLAVSVTICQKAGDLAHEAWSYASLASVAQEQGIPEEGREWLRRALSLFDFLGETGSIIFCLGRMAQLSALSSEEAAVLWSAYNHFCQEGGHFLSAEERKESARARTALRMALSENCLKRLEMRSASMSLCDVIRYVLEIDSDIEKGAAAGGRPR